jgi:hypothetical protein
MKEWPSNNSRLDFIMINKKHYDVRREVDRLIENNKCISQDIFNFFPETVTRLCQNRNSIHLIKSCINKPDYLIKIKCIWDYETLKYLAQNDSTLISYYHEEW